MYKITLLTLCFLLKSSFVFADDLTFNNGSNKLTGHYLNSLNTNHPKGIVLFVHGDGALPYDAEGYYKIIWQQLRKHGYSVFSWNKPGVGNSTGNWLEQSMRDRELEVLSAIELIQKKYGFSAKNTVLLGFSQAGWVIPNLASESDKIGFAIGIGFAKNWIDQGRFYTKIKHTRLGKNENEIQLEIENYNNEIASFKLSPSYSKDLEKEGLSKERFEFILKNFKSDATASYENISVPTLLLWGKNDLNVDANNEYIGWTQKPNKNVTIKLIDNATHGLLKSQSFSNQQFGFKQWLKLMWLKEDALAPEFLPTILNWLDQHVKA